jgi:hypothetical protein
MKQKQFKKFIETEIKILDDEKYYEGINRNCDPGEKFIEELIEKKSALWRSCWDNSCCKFCAFWAKCGKSFKKDCEEFESDNESEEELEI